MRLNESQNIDGYIPERGDIYIFWELFFLRLTKKSCVGYYVLYFK